MESLSNIFLYSVRELQEKLEQLALSQEEFVVKDLALKG
jgi:hypothetical protein